MTATQTNTICACHKRLWATEHDAAQVVVTAKLRAGLRGDQRRREQRAYPCPAGAGWHITSAPDTAIPTPRYSPDDDRSARQFLDRHLDRPVDDGVWRALLTEQYAAQTERVLVGMLRDLQAEMATRKAAADQGGRAARAEYKAWAPGAMARQALLAARRREIRPAVRAVNIAASAASAHDLSRRHRDAVRRLALAIARHRDATETPTAADRQLWTWLDVLTVPRDGEPASLSSLLETWT